MKRIKICILLISLLLAGCSSFNSYPTDDEYHFETDSQYTFCNQGKERKFAQSEDGYYFALTLQGNHFLFFTDKETMETVPVCNKPNCLHYAEASSEKRSLCNAYFNGIYYMTSVFYNNGKLYVPSRDGQSQTTILYEFSLDGSARKELFHIDSNGLYGTDLLFHRGYCYAMVNYYDEKQNPYVKLLRYSLDNPGREPEILLEQGEEKGSYERALLFSDLSAYGNHLYFSGNENGVRQFFAMDLRDKTPQPERLFTAVDADTAHLRNHMTIFGGRLLAAFNNDDYRMEQDLSLEEMPAVMYRSALDGSSAQPWMDVTYSPFAADDRYLYRWSFEPIARESGEMYIRIYDADGKLLVEENFYDELPLMQDLYVASDEKVFIVNRSNDTVWYFSKSEIETGTITPKLLIDCSAYATGS